jgi:hypothetical protein
MEKKPKTILSSSIMNQISDLVEQELKEKNIFYKRNGTIFNVREKNMGDLFKAQENANLKLLLNGVLTLEMLMHDFTANFG